MSARMSSSALMLVMEYARLQDQIAGAGKRIGEALELCPGVHGHRHEMEDVPATEWSEACRIPSERANADETHLKAWYTPDQDITGNTVYADPSADECRHCWAAHQIVQERKRARRALGSVKGRMRKLGRMAIRKVAVAALEAGAQGEGA